MGKPLYLKSLSLKFFVYFFRRLVSKILTHFVVMLGNRWGGRAYTHEAHCQDLVLLDIFIRGTIWSLL